MVLKNRKTSKGHKGGNIDKDYAKKSLKNNSIQKIHRKDFKSKNVQVKGYYTILIFLILVIFDRITKIWIITSGNKDYGIILLTYVTNTGAGFSIMQGMNLLLIIISILALLAIIYFRNHIPRFSVITITSGIVGNLIDRIFYGWVIDFINLKFWPIFNIADSLICIGVIYWIILLFIEEKNERRNKKNKHIKVAK